MRIGLITSTPDAMGEVDIDMPPLTAAFAAEGIEAVPAIWHDRGVGWHDFDALVIRSPWDYPDRPGDFMSWLDSLTVPVFNPRELIRWNLDKVYLVELAGAGVPIVATSVCTDLDQVRAALPTGPVVIKPTVSAGSRDTGLFAAGDPAALALAETIVAKGKVPMVQPAIASVAAVGEAALLYFGGVFSHAVRKGPLLAPGGGLIGGVYAEVIDPHTPTATEMAVAEAALAAVTERFGTPLYARFDIVDGSMLLEAELFEPSVFLEYADGAAERFVGACSAL
ncbi:MAG: ATP-grasp domain-containing protein [Nocardioides sp.]